MSKEASKKLTILGKEILPGESAQLKLEVAKLHTRTSLEVPILVERAREDGPVLMLLAGIHGDELNGIEIVRRIIRQGHHKPQKGTVVCIPVFNIFGFLNLSRQFPDGRDLNRVFPGTAKGSLASRFAYHFKNEIAPSVDYVIDFHTGSADRVNAPQIRCVFKEEKTLELAKIFSAPFIVQSKYIPKSLRVTLHKMGKTVLLFEGGKTKSFDEEVIRSGVQGIKNVMRFLGMQEGKVKKRNNMVLVEKSRWIRAPFSGMFHPVSRNGSYVEKGAIMGIITDPYGDFEKKIVASANCHIFCVNSAPIVNRGDALFHVST